MTDANRLDSVYEKKKTHNIYDIYPTRAIFFIHSKVLLCACVQSLHRNSLPQQQQQHHLALVFIDDLCDQDFGRKMPTNLHFYTEIPAYL